MLRPVILLCILLSGCTTSSIGDDAGSEQQPREGPWEPPPSVPIGTKATYSYQSPNITTRMEITAAPGRPELLPNGEWRHTFRLVSNQSVLLSNGLTQPGLGRIYAVDVESGRYVSSLVDGPRDPAEFFAEFYRLAEFGLAQARWISTRDPVVPALAIAWMEQDRLDWLDTMVVKQREGHWATSGGPQWSLEIGGLEQGWPTQVRLAISGVGYNAELELLDVEPNVRAPPPPRETKDLVFHSEAGEWAKIEADGNLWYPKHLETFAEMQIILPATLAQASMVEPFSTWIIDKAHWQRDGSLLVTQNGSAAHPTGWDGIWWIGVVQDVPGQIEVARMQVPWLAWREPAPAAVQARGQSQGTTLRGPEVDPLDVELQSPAPLARAAQEALGTIDHFEWRLWTPGFHGQRHYWSIGFECPPNHGEPSTMLVFDAAAGDLAGFWWKEPYTGVNACGYGVIP